ncbi:AMP-binding protein [Niveispirillum fermenti]|uniref:AMP-binding protein n=1 Tax=Niveispirillum fermenti TaxID=1233113 RepID=UPI003A89A2AF
MSFARTPPPAVTLDREEDGTIRLGSPLSMPTPAPSLAHRFDAVADAHPDRLFMRQRYGVGGWRDITYGAARRAADGLAQWLIDQGIGEGDSVAYLSAPSIEHGIAAVSVQRTGAAIAPISVAYSLLSTDHAKLKECVATAGARIVIVDDADRFAPALRALARPGLRFVAVTGGVPGLAVERWADVVATEPTGQVAERMAAIRPHMIARIMFTSGSTGSPKATPQPHACLTVSFAQMEAVNLLDFDGEPPQFLEAMPFSHIMAGNYNFGNIIAAGGTLWIDDGKPTPDLFARTIANLRDVSPHFFITVPLGYAMLCDAMEADTDLRDRFFRNIRWLGFGGALMPQSVAERLAALSLAARGAEAPVYSFYGATEFLLGALKYWPGGPTDVIGLPLPGVDLKLVPMDGRYEMRMRGPTLMPRSGYLGAADVSAGLFDAEGYFRTGDAVRFADPERPEGGLVFAGRLADDFKLLSGTYVQVNALRQDFLAVAEALVREAVFCGVNQDHIGALIWPRATLTPFAREELRALIADFNAAQTGSARRIGTALVMTEPLAFDRGEVTDKGNAAPRVVRERRAADVARLFADPPDPAILCFTRGAAVAARPRTGASNHA